MAQSDILKRYLDAGMAFTQLTRTRAEGIVKELVRAGEVRRERAQEAIDDLVDRSRRNTEALVTMVRKEVSSQLSQVGVATKLDLSRLERRLGLGGKKAPAKKAAPKKAPAKKTAAKKAPAKKAAAKKSPAKKSPAKKAAAKKAPTAKAPAAKAPAPPAAAPAAAPPQQTVFEAPPAATTPSFGFGSPLTPPSGGQTEQG